MADQHDCGRLAPFISAYASGEATATERTEVERALTQCPHCSSVLAGFAAMSTALKSRLPQSEPPPGLWGRLVARLDEVDLETRRPAHRTSTRWAWAVPIAVITVAAVWAFVFASRRPLDLAPLVQADALPAVTASLHTSSLQQAVEWAEPRAGARLKPISLGMMGYYLTQVSIGRIDGAATAAFSYRGASGQLTVYQIQSNSRPLRGKLQHAPGHPPVLRITGRARTLVAVQHTGETYVVAGKQSVDYLNRISDEVMEVCR